ncbi:MAG: hypothetical protein K1X64_15205 [Myxococcaceae bacterium]|nr:hypothetical protein [Myxococcaceae bacterium]
MLTVVLTSLSALASAVQPGAIIIESPTLHSIGLEWDIAGDTNRNATVKVEYRAQGTTPWRTGLPMLRQQILTWPSGVPSPPDHFAGSVLQLAPETTYEIRLTMTDADGGGTSQTVTARTRGEPRSYAMGRTLYAVPGSGGGAGSLADPFKGLAAAEAGAQAGDIVLLQPGTYTGPVALTKSGTPGKPIVYRGADKDSVVIDGNGGSYGLNLDGLSYIHLEQMTIRNHQLPVQAQGSSNIALRYLKLLVLTADKAGVSIWGNDNYFCDNELTGAAGNFPAYLSNPEGLLMTGEGHVICHNSITHFRDAITLVPRYPGQAPARSIDIYGNDIFDVADDGVEADYSFHNVRIFKNRMRNYLSAVSMQPSVAGPTYVFRNEFFSMMAIETSPPSKTISSPYKISESSGQCTTGLQIFHNSSVNIGSAMLNAGTVFPNSTMRNNLAYGTSGPVMQLYKPAACSIPTDAMAQTFDYNGMNTTWGYWARIFDNAGVESYYTLPQFRLAPMFNELHGFALTTGEFTAVPTLTQDRIYQPSEWDFTPQQGSNAVNQAELIAGLNDDVPDGMPDIGAIERGAPKPVYGPRPPTFLTTDEVAPSAPVGLSVF